MGERDKGFLMCHKNIVSLCKSSGETDQRDIHFGTIEKKTLILKSQKWECFQVNR